MNTYQITAVYYRNEHDFREEVELIDAPSLERARMKFKSCHPSKRWVITGEELIHTDIPERERPASIGRSQAKPEPTTSGEAPEPPQEDQEEEIRQLTLRAMRAEAEVVRLKAKLYDYLTRGAGRIDEFGPYPVQGR